MASASTSAGAKCELACKNDGVCVLAYTGGELKPWCKCAGLFTGADCGTPVPPWRPAGGTWGVVLLSAVTAVCTVFAVVAACSALRWLLARCAPFEHVAKERRRRDISGKVVRQIGMAGECQSEMGLPPLPVPQPPLPDDAKPHDVTFDTADTEGGVITPECDTAAWCQCAQAALVAGHADGALPEWRGGAARSPSPPWDELEMRRNGLVDEHGRRCLVGCTVHSARRDSLTQIGATSRSADVSAPAACTQCDTLADDWTAATSAPSCWTLATDDAGGGVALPAATADDDRTPSIGADMHSTQLTETTQPASAGEQSAGGGRKRKRDGGDDEAHAAMWI